MIHTASLVHDDILDHAETRRGKVSVNLKWSPHQATMAGAYILAVASRLLASTGNRRVVEILSQVLADLVQGEFMQLQTKQNEEDRFEDYINKSFNKTASLMAYSCQAVAVLAEATDQEAEEAFRYGKQLGIAFQLVDDLLDFVSSADQLGKPAAADLELGLATAPVLFAAAEFPQLHEMIGRRFQEEGDVQEAFRLVLQSRGLEETRALARRHCQDAINSLEAIKPSPHRAALVRDGRMDVKCTDRC
jgi:decaprenyl-diphosphate synthase subunit 1